MLQTLNIKLSNATVADYRAWGSAISAGLAAAGFVKSADTGQIAWATVALPTALGVPNNYEIWKFNDTLSATKPVFIKIEYSIFVTGGSPAIGITVGTGSDGLGNLTGKVGARLFVAVMNNTAGLVPVSLSTGGGRLMLYLPGELTTFGNSAYILVERTKDSNGNDSGLGVFYGFGGVDTAQVSKHNFQYVSFDTATIPQLNAYVPCIMPTGTTFQLFNNVGVGPVFPLSDSIGNPITSMLVYLDADIASGTQVVVPMYGVNVTYLATGVRLKSVVTPYNAGAAILVRVD